MIAFIGFETPFGIIYIFSVTMSSPVKRHRRNCAIQQDEDHYRMSVPLPEIISFRQTFDVKYQPILTYRSSDLTQVPNITSRSKECSSKKELSVHEVQGQKTEKKLLQTFKDLQKKLAQAKRQLMPQNEKTLCEFSFELDAFKQSSTNSSMGLGDALFEKLQESTINLESNRRLINAIKSKERIIWANKIKTYYLKEVTKGIIGLNQRAFQHIAISHQILKTREQSDLPDETVIPRRKLNIKLTPENIGKKVLVLDLDETLFHTEETRMSQDDLEIDIPVEGGYEKAYISLRPYALSFLKRCKKNFEIITFTASQKSYADAILNEIDPNYDYISYRLYREHCIRLDNRVYAKDLTIINRELSQMVLVDNSPLSYLYQVQNGVPILPYNGGEDSELLALEKYLDQIKNARDVRPLNVSTFKLHRYGSFEDCESLVKQLYCGYAQS